MAHSVTYTYKGSDHSDPDWFFFHFLASDNRVYDTYSTTPWCSPPALDVGDVGDMYPGASVTANGCVSVPTQLAKGGLWRISDMDDPVYVRAN